MSVLSVLGLIFITLKLCEVITWSWIWVLFPFWIGFISWFIAVVIIGMIIDKRNKK